jgi:hypothetical protein
MKLIRLICPCLVFLSTMVLAQSNPVPLANNPLVPASAAPGGTDFTLTVNGTGFAPGSSVNWNGTPLATKLISSSQLTATVPAADIAKPGAASVTVVNPGPGGGSSNVEFFAIRKPFTAVSFGKSAFEVGSTPGAVATADLNSDGKLDLVSTAGADSAVSVLLGNGDGTFRPSVQYLTATSPEFVIIGDFNGDGRLDLAVSTFFFVSVLLGNGDGTFQSHQDYGVSSVQNRGLATGDFNQDGKLDLAVVPASGGQVAILLGKGDGTFQSAVDYTAGSDRAEDVAVGDFNGDGKLDLAVTVFDDISVAILLGKGDGTFGTSNEYATGELPEGIASADLNGDGILDLVVHTIVGSGNSGGIAVLLGKGDGTFAPHVDYAAPEGESFSIVAADLSGDGKLDVAIPNVASTISTFIAKGDGTFLVPGFFASGPTPLGMAVGDFDGDGKLDLVEADNGGNTVSVLSQVTSGALKDEHELRCSKNWQEL